MKLVIDSNKMQDDDLRRFLSKSKNNFAVITDYVAMEAYKGSTLNSIFKSMEILSSYSSQVIILKNTCFASNQRGRLSGLQRRLIDKKQTEEFPKYIDHLVQAKSGDIKYQKKLLSNGAEATDHFEKLLKTSVLFKEAIHKISLNYTKDERKIIRENKVIPKKILEKAIKDIMDVSIILFRQDKNVKFIPSSKELPNTFIFRLVLCTYLFCLERGVNGGAKGDRAENLRNDIVDMYFIAYATYFDGILSGENMVLDIHMKTRLWLIHIFGCNLSQGVGHTPMSIP